MRHRFELATVANLSVRLGLAMAVLGLVVTGVDAMPMNATVLRDSGATTEAIRVQHRPGYYKGREYRREMRRYRGDPGARYILRNKRRVFCRRSPQYC